MADRTDYHFRQRVTEAELDLAFDLLEKADRNLVADLGIYGIIVGAVPSSHAPVPDLTIDLTAPARAYDHLGQRLFFGTAQTIDCSVDHTGVPTEVPGPDQERWLGVFLRFERALSDLRTDGNSQPVYFRRDEAVAFRVRQGPVGPIDAAPRVALQPDELLICEVRRRPGQSQIVDDDIDTTRRQDFVFASGNAIEIVSNIWNLVQPAANTVQAALDAIDAALYEHITGAARRHPATDIDYTPRGFLAATTVQAAVDELIDDLSTGAAGTPGASRIGADSVAGTPHALPTGTVDGQLAQLLAWINQHVVAPASAHNASAIAATPHHYISGTSVQAQLEEMTADLQTQTSGAAGATRIGAESVAGTPTQLAAGTVASQLVQLVGDLNAHTGAATDAHAASAVSIADTADHFAADHVEGAVAEMATMFAGDHFRANQPNPGQHRTIRQPALGTGLVLLWDAAGTGSLQGHLRVYADSDFIWFTINAAWNGSAWQRDSTGHFAGGFRFSRYAFEFVHYNDSAATFTRWSRTWRLPMSSAVNSGFEIGGTVRETGFLGMEGTNTYTSTRSMALGGAVTFRARFPTTPSSITLSPTNISSNWSGPPIVWISNRDGFGFYDFQNAAGGETIYWFGTYNAIA